MEHKYLDRDWLYEQYIIQNRTIKSISEECGVKHQSVERFLKRYGIKKFKTGKLPTPDELRELHINQGIAIRKIANMYSGVGVDTIKKIMTDNGIEIISHYEMLSKWWADEDNKKQMSEIRVDLWKNKSYRDKNMAHLRDKETIMKRAKMVSAKYQGVSLEDWNGFLTPQQTRIRNSEQYAQWRKSVFERDNYTCQCCGARSRKGNPVTLHAHHLENFAHNEELRFDVNNGITLCKNCHDIRVVGSFHNLYGIHNNTRKQFDEYMSNRKM